jgi:hypothetical protein
VAGFHHYSFMNELAVNGSRVLRRSLDLLNERHRHKRLMT